jgi:tetratricopeptide (TPR) repeat protein
MRLAFSWIIIVLLAALLLPGCRLPGRDGPVPKSLAECRRLSQQGVSALDRGRQQDAEALLAKAVAACPSDAEAHRHYAESLWRRGARPEAIAQIEESGRLAGDDPLLWTRLAEMYLATGQLELASKNAEHAIELDPRQPSAWAIRGALKRTAGQPAEALTCYLRALGYAPKDRAILFEIAELYRRENRPERALQTLQSLAETYSPGEEPGQVLDLMGQAFVALGRYDDAVESMSLAAARDKPSPEVLCRLGEAQLLAGHPIEASAAAQRALALQPRHPSSMALLDRIQLAQQPQGTMR